MPNEDDGLAAAVATQSWLNLCLEFVVLIEFSAAMTAADYQFLEAAGISTE